MGIIDYICSFNGTSRRSVLNEFEFGTKQFILLRSFFSVIVAAWGLMESIWGLLEAFIEGFSNAGSVRLALHLGKGNIEQAKRSAWKSLFLVTTLGFVISVIYAIIGDQIAVLFTSDKTLQDMLKAMIPIICFGNVFQSFGSMAWCLVSEICLSFHSDKIFVHNHFIIPTTWNHRLGLRAAITTPR